MSLKPPSLSSEALSVIITDRCVDMDGVYIMCVRYNVVVVYVYKLCAYIRDAYCAQAGKRSIIGILYIGKDCVVADDGKAVETAIVTRAQDTRDSRLDG